MVQYKIYTFRWYWSEDKKIKIGLLENNDYYIPPKKRVVNDYVVNEYNHMILLFRELVSTCTAISNDDKLFQNIISINDKFNDLLKKISSTINVPLPSNEIFDLEIKNDDVQIELDNIDHEISKDKLEVAIVLGSGLYLDASNKEDCIARCINHSCSPNAPFQTRCIINELSRKKETRVIVLASRDIKAVNEQIIIDYNYGTGSIYTKCLCGAPVCRGVLGKAEQY